MKEMMFCVHLNIFVHFSESKLGYQWEFSEKSRFSLLKIRTQYKFFKNSGPLIQNLECPSQKHALRCKPYYRFFIFQKINELGKPTQKLL